MKESVKEYSMVKAPEKSNDITFGNVDKENIKKAVTDYIEEYAKNNKVAPEYFGF